MRGWVLLPLLAIGCGPARPLHDDPESLRRGLAAGDRPTSPSAAPPRFEPTEQVESVVSPGGRFRIHFTRSGPNAVGAADSDGDGIPDAVDVVARTYDRVAVAYAGWGYALPPEDSFLPGDFGGDGLFDVYLVDFAGRADGAYRMDACRGEQTQCAGHMLQENDFAGYSYPSYEAAVTTVASHEFFHGVQAAYRPDLGNVASEGTAVWATERFEPSLDDLEHFSAAYLERPDRSLVLDPDGPSSFSYGGSLFFQFLSERFGDRLLLSMFQESVQAPSTRWPMLLDGVLRREWSADFDTAFAGFAEWNLATGSRAQPGQGYARGGGYAELTVASKTFPVDEPMVRVAPASTRYFDVEGGAESVSASFEPAEDTDSAALHLLVAAVNEHAVLRVARADGPGPLRAQVSAADATRVVVAVVDGRQEGLGRYGRLCVAAAATDSPCGDEEETPAPGEDGGCQAAPGGWLWALPWLAWALGRGRRR